MIRGLLICPDGAMAERLNQALASSGGVEFTRTLDAYPSPTDLIRMLRGGAVEALFLSLESLETAVSLAKHLGVDAPHVPVIAVLDSLDPVALRETMRLGIRDFLTDPFDHDTVADAITHVTDILQKAPARYQLTEQVFSFLPSKAGVGTSTVALNSSAALAQLPDQSTLLADFDLNSGMTRFMLNLNNTFSVIDAIEASGRMEDNIWKDLITSRGKLDILHSGRIKPNYRIEPAQIRDLVAFLRRTYSTVCFDLSGNLERYSVELMLESKHVLLVLTPELPSLHVAREKLAFLKEFELTGRAVAILNRVGRTSVVSPSQVEDLLQIPVLHSFPNDYLGINRAVTKGSPIALDSPTGRSFAEFANKLLKHSSANPKSPEKKKVA